MTDNQGGEAASVDTEAAEQAALSSQGDNDFEARARDMGWVPEAEWKGDKRPAKFLSAEDFVERGENIIPLLKSQMKKDREDFEKRIERMEKMNEKTRVAAEKAHATRIAELEKQSRQAAYNGKGTEFDAIQAEIAAAKKDGPTALEEDPAAAKQKVQDKWIAENEWYRTDEEMSAYAFGVSNRIAEKQPDLSFEENLKLMTEKVKAKYPEKFGAPASANGHALVDGGGAASGPRSDPLGKLPAEARAQARADMKAYPKIYPTAETWIKAYGS